MVLDGWYRLLAIMRSKRSMWRAENILLRAGTSGLERPTCCQHHHRLRCGSVLQYYGHHGRPCGCGICMAEVAWEACEMATHWQAEPGNCDGQKRVSPSYPCYLASWAVDADHSIQTHSLVHRPLNLQHCLDHHHHRQRGVHHNAKPSIERGRIFQLRKRWTIHPSIHRLDQFDQGPLGDCA
jgi:hypothetical protein